MRSTTDERKVNKNMKKQNVMLEYQNKELLEIVIELNYSNLIMMYNSNDYEKLLSLLMDDHCSHMHYFTLTTNLNMFYIENCDMQNIYSVNELIELIDDEGYILCDIVPTKNGFIFNEICRSNN